MRSPLRWMHSTGSHWMVAVEKVLLDTLTERGAAEGTVEFKHTHVQYHPMAIMVPHLLPMSVQ